MARDTTRINATCEFGPYDVMSWVGKFDGRHEKWGRLVEDWLLRNAKHIEEAMCRAGWEAIDTLLSIDPIGDGSELFTLDSVGLEEEAE